MTNQVSNAELEAAVQLCSDIAVSLVPLIDALVSERMTLSERVSRELLSAERLCNTLSLFGGKAAPTEERINLTGWLAENRNALMEQAGGAMLTLHISPGLPALDANSRALREAVGELIDNAVQAGASRIELRATVEQDSEHGRRACLTVRDDAGGMPARLATRCHLPGVSGTGRAGLGLARVHGIARQHNGVLELDGDAGEGTEARLYIGQRPPRRRRPSVVRDLPLGQERVLVVDDEPLAREAVRRVLASLGYDVTAANCGNEALAYYKEQPPFALLLCDVNMPDMPGFEVAARVKTQNPDTKVLFMCGYPPDTIEGAPIGALFLEKPFSHRELAHKLREVLDS